MSPGPGETLCVERAELKKLADFNGNYTAAGAGATVGGGAGATIMKNQNGVVIELTSTTQGASLKLAIGLSRRPRSRLRAVQERLRVLEVLRVEPFREGREERAEKPARAAGTIAPRGQTREAHQAPELERSGLLPPGDREGAANTLPGGVRQGIGRRCRPPRRALGPSQEEVTLDAPQLSRVQVITDRLGEREPFIDPPESLVPLSGLPVRGGDDPDQDFAVERSDDRSVLGQRSTSGTPSARCWTSPAGSRSISVLPRGSSSATASGFRLRALPRSKPC